jgi:MoaA/NifB/PqqE/SkfB family radical SAM enzyme
MLGVALLTYLRIPTSLSIIVDRRSRRQVEEVAALAEGLGCLQLHYILPQPVPGSVERDSDLPPEEWREVVREVHALAARPGRRTAIQLDYGAPFDGEEALCDTFAGQRVYVDAEGRLSTCCQLSEYGENTADVVADLHQVSLADAWPAYLERLRVQQMGSARPASGADEFDDFPCIRCARFTGKMEWMRQYPEHRWSRAVRPAGRPSGERTLVQLSRSPALSAVSDR